MAIPGINDDDKHMKSIASFIDDIGFLKNNIMKIEILPFHNKGIIKYKENNLSYRFGNIEPLDDEKAKYLNDLLNSLVF